jgi:hypothetical protein
MAKLKFIDNPSNYEYVTNKLIRCRKATIIEDILKYQNKVPDTYLYIRSIEFVKGCGIINDEYEVHLEVYKAKQPCKCLEDEVNNLKIKLENAEKRLEQYKKTVVFMPIEKEPFWFLDASGNPINDGFTASCDQGKLDFGNCFRCLDDAVVASKQILIYRKLRAVAKELNEGIPIDWFNNKQKKFFISADPDNKELKLVQNCTTYNNIAGVVYCLSDRFLNSCVETIGRDDIMDYIKWN